MIGRKGSFIILLGLLIFCSTNHATAQLALDVVLKDCEKKTIVMGRDEKGELVKVGENLNGYCRGVLEGVFAVLIRNKAICLKDRSSTATFLLSTVQTYRAQSKSQDNDAFAVIEAAFKRAFGCAN